VRVHAKIVARDDERGPNRAGRADEVQEGKQRLQKQPEIEGLEYRRPKIADKPPFPKLAINDTDFDLGTIHVNKVTGHKFKIWNIGQAPLVLHRGPPHCKASPLNIPQRQEVPPGGSIVIELPCTPREAVPPFAKTVEFWTNDPVRPELDLKIRAKVVP
jgi:hypothetical protein